VVFVASPFRNLKLLGRRVGRSMLKMNKREEVRKRKAEHYFGKQPEIFGNESQEEIISEETDKNLSTGDHEEDFFDEDEEAWF